MASAGSHNTASGTKTLFSKLVMSVEKTISANQPGTGSKSPDFGPSQVSGYRPDGVEK
jgi:hypothetical protein